MKEPPLPPGQQLAAPNKWPIVGERLPPPKNPGWSVRISGLVRSPCEISLDAFQRLPWVDRTIDIHCVTRWSKFDLHFSGVLLRDVLDTAAPTPDAQFVRFVAESGRHHSTSLVLDEALQLDTLVALTVDGEPLPVEHGGPVRLIVPGRYFYKSLKWLRRIELLAEDRLGYWEAEAGYHNRADPWREERFLLPGRSKQEAAGVLDSRDITGRKLAGIDLAGRSLAGLQAAGAILRNADFRRCDLEGACFDGANLSGALLSGADLGGASFRDADLEGADLAGADLAGADFRGASLLAASFCHAQGPIVGAEPSIDDGARIADPAHFDANTQFDDEAIEMLMPQQQAFFQTKRGTDFR